MENASPEISQFLNKQFHSSYDTTEWFVSFTKAVHGLSEEQAQQKVNSELPSIFEIVAHLTYWNERYLKKMKNEPQSSPMISDNEQTFTNSEFKSWSDLLQKAGSVFEGWAKHLEKLTNKDAEHFGAIGNTSMHNAYHIGQIVFLRKLQESWNNDNGVK